MKTRQIFYCLCKLSCKSKIAANLGNKDFIVTRHFLTYTRQDPAHGEVRWTGEKQKWEKASVWTAFPWT